MARSGKKNQLASRCNPGLCERQTIFHIVDRAKSDGVETTIGWHRLDTARPDFGAEIEGADGFPQESGLFVLRFGERDVNVTPEKGNGKAGEACPRAKVEQGRGIGVKMTSGEETLSEVAANDLFGIADRGEVRARIPFQEEVEVERELGEQPGGRIRKVGNQEVSDFGFRESWHRG